MNNKTHIAVCAFSSLVRVEWCMEFWGQYKPFGRQFNLSVIVNVSPVSVARNIALYEAKKAEANYCLFYDDDIIPKRRDAVGVLVSAMDQIPEATLLGSVCAVRASVPEPIVIKHEGEGPWFGWQDGDIHQVFHSGTGFLLIRMDDLDDIDVPVITVEGREVRQFFNEYNRPGDPLMTDDYYFAHIMKDNGKKWLVHGSILCDQIDKDGTRYEISNSLIVK